MRWSVFAYQTSPVKAKHHRQLLYRHIMHHHIISPLHKRRIDIAEHPHALCCQTSTQRNCMLFTNTHIKSPVRHFFHHIFQRRTTRHGRCDTHDSFVHFCQLYHCMTKYVLVFGGLWNIKCFLLNFTGYFIKQTGCMPFGLIQFCQ